MNSKKILFVAILFSSGLQVAFAQNPPPPQVSETVAKNTIQTTEIPRERREQAYIKLLEGQRYIWNMSNRSRSQAADRPGR